MTGLRRNPSNDILNRYQCTKSEWLMLRDLGLDMMARGICKSDNTPLRAYQHQRFAAEVRRDVPWKLTLMEWWSIWDASGHWADRGLGRGWQMCRKGDLGAYEVGNVFIGLGAENLSAAAKVADLPIGVAFAVKGRVRRYRAYCNVYGRQRHIGLFDTVEDAERAYLKAVELDDEMKALADQRFDVLKADVQGKPLASIVSQAEVAALARNRRAA
jgi:hypothetical protein